MAESKSAALPLGYAPLRRNLPRLMDGFNVRFQAQLHLWVFDSYRKSIMPNLRWLEALGPGC
jgi:hypothetical protein